MRSKWFTAVAVGAFTLAALSFGEEESATIEETTSVPAQEQFLASIEIAPAITPNPSNVIDGEDATAVFENEVSLGYQFSENLAVRYVQPFEIEMANTSSNLLNGSIRGYFNNVYSNNGFSYSIEPRAYLPTSSVEGATDGMITELRLKNKFAYEASPSTTLVGEINPSAFIFDSAAVTPDMGLGVKIGAEFALSDSVVVKVPLEWVATRTGVWGHSLSFWPEVEYSFQENMSVGGAYRSASLVDDEFGGRLGDGLAEGAFLGFFRASL